MSKSTDRSIKRSRRPYLDCARELAPYLSFPAFDDEQSIARSRVICATHAWTVLPYPSGLILVINSLLAGALAGRLVIALFRAQLWQRSPRRGCGR